MGCGPCASTSGGGSGSSGTTGSEVDPEQAKRDKQVAKEIDTGLKDYVTKEKKDNKLLLLGTGSSGKSTLFKGLRLINGETFANREQTDTRHVIRANVNFKDITVSIISLSPVCDVRTLVFLGVCNR